MRLSRRCMSRLSESFVSISSVLVEYVTSKSSMRFDVQPMKQYPSLYLPGISASRLRPPSVGAKYRPRCPGSTMAVAQPVVARAPRVAAVTSARRDTTVLVLMEDLVAGLEMWRSTRFGRRRIEAHAAAEPSGQIAADAHHAAVDDGGAFFGGPQPAVAAAELCLPEVHVAVARPQGRAHIHADDDAAARLELRL